MRKSGRKAEDLTGFVGPYFTVLRRYGTYRSPKGRTAVLWLCRCGCGVEFAAHAYAITSGYRKSCGCLREMTFQEKEMRIRDFAGKSDEGHAAESGKQPH